MQPRTTPQAPQKPSGARPGRPAASDEIRKRRRSLARSLAIAAAACVAYLPVDLTWEHGKAIVAWRLSWIGVLACAAVGQLRWSARMASAAVHAAAAMSGVATVAIFQLAGGSAHPAFGFVLALPLAVQVLAPDYVWAGLLTGLITGVGGAATLVADGRSAREVGEWMLISAALSALAATGAASFRRLWLKELRVERERNAALERLVTVERLATVGQLAAGVAHEVNNPLSYVNANVQFAVQELAAQDAAPADVLEALREAVDGTRRVTEIVQALKILGRTSPTTQPTEVDLRKVLDATLAVAGNDLRRRARLVCELSEVPPVVGDEGRLGQVLLDLLNNAVQAIEAGHPEENTIMVRLRHVGEQVLVEVADTGASIASGDLARVFDPFFPARWPVGGFGLGLAVAQRIATELGGTIEAQSRPGEGAAFRLSLPEARQGGADRQKFDGAAQRGRERR